VMKGQTCNRTSLAWCDVAVPYDAARKNAEFRLEFADHVHRHFFNGGALYVASNATRSDPTDAQHNVPAARFERLARQIEHAIIAESARWGDQHSQVPYTRDEHWAIERKRVLEKWLPQRSAVVLDQLRAAGLYPNVEAPSFNTHGGAVPSGFLLKMSAPTGTIYFTLDGSDPRKSATAAVYESAIMIKEQTTAKARVVQDKVWSALNEASFTIEGSERAGSAIQ